MLQFCWFLFLILKESWSTSPLFFANIHFQQSEASEIQSWKRSKTHSTEHSKEESWLPNVKPPHSPCNCLAAHQFTLSYDAVLRPLGPKWTVQFKSLQGIAECLAARTLTMTKNQGLSESHTRNRRIWVTTGISRYNAQRQPHQTIQWGSPSSASLTK